MVNCNDYQKPELLKKIKCLTHTKGKEERCFYNGVHLLFINPKKNKQRPLKIDSPFNWENVNLPPTREDLKQFERNNPSFHILVFGYDEEREEPFYNYYLDRIEEFHIYCPKSFIFIYHQSHFISVTRKSPFYEFLNKKYKYTMNNISSLKY